MSEASFLPGTATLDILVERHRSLLASRGEDVTKAEAIGKLLAVYLRYDRELILKAIRAALDEAALESDEDCVQATNSHSSNGTTH